MPYNVKEIVANKPSRFTAGHRMCAGCGAPPAARMIMRALKPEDHAVLRYGIRSDPGLPRPHCCQRRRGGER